MSRQKINLVTALAETYGRTMTEPAVKLYVAALATITDEQATQAAMIALQKSKFFPTASDLIEYSRTNGIGYDSQAELAWEELDRALSANKPSMMSPATAAVCRQIGGFQALYATPVPELTTWKRKEFLTAYVALAKESPERLLAIAGPQSDLAQGMLKHVPGREQVAAIEDKNRKLLADLGAVK